MFVKLIVFVCFFSTPKHCENFHLIYYGKIVQHLITQDQAGFVRGISLTGFVCFGKFFWYEKNINKNTYHTITTHYLCKKDTSSKHELNTNIFNQKMLRECLS